MNPQVKNIIIFAVAIGALALIYIFFIKGSPPEESLVPSTPFSALPNQNAFTNIEDQNSLIAGDFLALLLNVKNIKLNDIILSDVAFTNLRDSSITLTPDQNEGRSNPFAPIGSENIENTESVTP